MLLFLYLLYVIIIIIIIFTCCLCKSLCLLKALTSSFVKPLETTQNLCQRFRLLPGSLPSILDLIPKIWFLWFTPPYSILDFYFLSIHVLSIHLVFLALIFFFSPQFLFNLSLRLRSEAAVCFKIVQCLIPWTTA